MVVKESMAETKSKLTNTWHNQKDLNTAFDLTAWLEFFDKRLFPDKPLSAWFIGIEPTDFVVQYFPVRLGAESYCIYLYKLAERIDEVVRGITLVTKDGKIIKHPLDYSEKKRRLLIEIAVHEVRHRLQQRTSLKKIRRKDEGLTNNLLLKESIEAVITEFKRRKNVYKKMGKDALFIKKITNNREFDATVTECFVSSLLYKKVDLSEIVSAVKIQA